MAGEPSEVAETTQPKTLSRKARRRAEKEQKREEKIMEAAARHGERQEAYWNMSVEERKAADPYYMEIEHEITNDEIIDRLMNYWEE
ncbi:uncharacterized protein FTOL_08293 [Fusarium torulosum]|uniref:Uncharacterized protein n=1 Tax=Fusarium torulosum TaxID=33205 RepID=A0AAE8MDV3_9HYPO|nr:uncharacterized protein FTOL_08293 [Fusarium torulosum]